MFRSFLTDTLLNAGLEVLALAPSEMDSVIAPAQQFNLDFDDAYQYAVAEKNNLTLVSFDSDFARTERGHKTPVEIL